MNERGRIYHLRHHEIDKSRWDACIGKAPNGLIYAYSFYLDQMAANWDALVMGDYEMVMPLTWNKKWGLSYLYQPFLAAQLGLFGGDAGSGVRSFIDAIPKSFRFAEISLNHGNVAGLTGMNFVPRNNFVLPLQPAYNSLYNNYRENIRRNIRKAKELGCTATKDVDVERVIELATRQMRSYGKESSENVDRFRRLYEILLEKKMATTYGILSPGNELIASCVFFFSHHRAYYILVGNHPNGRTIGASHALIDEFIRDHAGQNLVLDFEGSDLRNLAFFYSGFGATVEIFPFIRFNNLPWYVRWVKE